MKNTINVLTIILHVLKLMRKHKMSKNEAAATTAAQFGISLSDVLEVIVEYLKKKD
ncbi:hypothetical protein M3182_04325 [Mesobacillus maritimus]|uniref:hypothetical protein n=1 Tax=Mesobacillus maritimus TaxID=1643336 RepID=UPI002040DE78|nr:hypothetical protein [Mesobacillus maritimus]MCM3584972.1 hypothetical protein [Mesobacillus maritimus]